MKIIGRHILEQFVKKHSDSKNQIAAWCKELEKTRWQSSYDIRAKYPSASLIGEKNVVFNIKGNKYRLWVIVDYTNGVVLIKNAGTHKAYDSWRIK
jgi:mRNA interferase HigB